jgi:hypothetical protein
LAGSLHGSLLGAAMPQCVAPVVGADVVPVKDVEPPQRDIDIEPFKKHRLVPVLFGLQSQHGVVPRSRGRAKCGQPLQVQGEKRISPFLRICSAWLPQVTGDYSIHRLCGESR